MIDENVGGTSVGEKTTGFVAPTGRRTSPAVSSPSSSPMATGPGTSPEPVDAVRNARHTPVPYRSPLLSPSTIPGSVPLLNPLLPGVLGSVHRWSDLTDPRRSMSTKTFPTYQKTFINLEATSVSMNEDRAISQGYPPCGRQSRLFTCRADRIGFYLIEKQ